MAIVDLIMPKMGESIMEATILKWHKSVGEHVKQEEIVLDIATDKVDSEIPSTAEGILKELLFNVNDVVPVGAVIARIETSVAAEPAKTPVAVAPAPIAAPVKTPIAETPKEEHIPYIPTTTTSTMSNNNRFFSPLVLNIANSEGLSLSELENIAGTGAENRVTKRDILQYVADKKAGKVQYVAAAPVYYTQPAAPIEVAKPAEVIPEVVAVAATVAEVAHEAAPTEHDTSAFIKQEVSLPPVVEIKEEPIVEEVIHAAKRTDDIPVAIAPTEAAPAYVAPAAPVEEPKPIYVAPTPVEVAPIVAAPAPEAKHTPVYIADPAAPTQQIVEAQAKEAYRVSYEEHQKLAAQSVAKETYIKPTNQNIIMPEVSNEQAPKPSVEIIEMDRMRKLIAKHMVNSVQTAPHVTSFAEADVTNMVQWRERVKGDFEKREGIKLTYTPMFIECILKVLKRYPLINSSVDGDKIIIKNFFNIGFATSLPNGNLIVPVIKDAQNHNLISLTRSVSTLADNARNNKLKPEDTTDGTFTFSNLGNFGSLMGTPIINQPQSAIMAVGAIKKRPVVIETDKGDFIGIRQMMYLSLSFDHRIIDGSVGASFLNEVAKEFENWNLERELKYVVKEWYVE